MGFINFLAKFSKVHGTFYDYSEFDFKTNATKGVIICPKHGRFTQTPSSHSAGHGCPSCGREKRVTTLTADLETFLKKANNTHNNLYDYSEVTYRNSKTKVAIICSTHGKFMQIPAQHIQGRGCPLCGHEKQSIALTKTHEQFLLELFDKFNKLDFEIIGKYERVDKRLLVLAEGIEYMITPNELLDGVKPCLVNCIEPTKLFLNKFKKVHGDKYDYSKYKYNSDKSPSTIICKVHGEFKQKTAHHSSGSGCQDCAKDNNSGWTKTSWLASANNSSKFQSFKLYIVNFFDSEESFIKIGITYKDLSKRMNAIPYQHRKLFTLTLQDHAKIMTLERELHFKYRDYKYIPTNIFGGMHECFNLSLPIDEIISYLSLQVHDITPTTN